MYAFAYAVASALAAWESGRLREAAVWDLAPARSRYRIAANILFPALALAWFMLFLAVALRLIQEGVAPTLDSVRPLLLGVLLCLAHAVIGFTIGLHVPRLLAAPLVTVMTWVLVAFSVTSTQFWYRHVSGQRTDSLAFGEIVPFSSLAPHLLFTGSIAMAALLLWMPIRHGIIRACLATSVAIAGMSTAHGMVERWGPHDPVLSGQAPVQCFGKAPAVCMPKVSAGRLPAVRKQVDSVLSDFRAAGIEASPTFIIDSLADGRRHVGSTPSTWRVSLTHGTKAGNVRYLLVNAAVPFSCVTPDPKLRREALLWAATIAGEGEAYAKQWTHSPEEFDLNAANRDRVYADVKKVRTLSVSKQADWFERTVVTACERD
ncbi:DUF7224 domain-containing protein [Streptomyces cadmiisoli]|uniref:DUF7224 domain-containing protein n=1 Tax=Streptomyces cadmiisoli TaxID=2184053 RepID=UPI00364AD879